MSANFWPELTALSGRGLYHTTHQNTTGELCGGGDRRSHRRRRASAETQTTVRAARFCERAGQEERLHLHITTHTK